MFLRISSVQSLSRVWLFVTPWTTACQASCPSPTPRVYSNSCPLSRWCHPTISSSVVPFSSHLQSFPASGSFQMSQLFASGGQSIAFSFNISPSNEHSGLISFRMGWFLRIAIVKSWLCDRHFIHQLYKHYLLTTAILWGIYCLLVLQMKKQA